MTNLTTRFLSRLASHTISGVELFDGAIYPKYEDQSILNIPSTVCEWMDVPRLSANPLKREIISPLEGGVKHDGQESVQLPMASSGMRCG